MQTRRLAMLALACGSCLVAAASCKPAANGGSAPVTHHPHPVSVEMPWETTAVRDNHDAPILKVVKLDDGGDGVTLPYVYGYPIYPEGDAAKGLLKLQGDNWTGASRQETPDQDGVAHMTEELPALGCRIEGIQETPTKLVPLSITCDLPPPKALGGTKRPVLGEVATGAKPAQLLKDESIEQAFLGDFHLVSGDLEKSHGVGYFNTTHGQLAFGFERGHLARVIYYFDPNVKGWQDPALWVTP